MAKKTIDFDVVREIALALPDVEETTIHGAPCFKFRGKLLTCQGLDQSVEPNTLAVRINFDQRAKLLAADPNVCYVTDHYMNYPTVLVRLSRIANYRPFPQSQFDETWHNNMIFLADNLNEKLKQSVNALRTNTDVFEVHGREIYWRRRRKQNRALLSTVPLEKILGPAFTVRGTNTIEKIVSKYCSSKVS